MSNFPNAHLYCNNNIYKIVLSMEDIGDSSTTQHTEDDKNIK